MPRYEANEPVPHFCTITVLDWLPILIESRYIDPILDSLRFCREKKGLELHAFVVMPNHLHLIAAADEQLHAVMRDFKRFTSRQLHDLLKADGRTTIIDWMRRATDPARRARGELGLWQPGFHPQAIYSQKVFDQKLEYLHNNPVRKGLVQKPEDWWYSSAGGYEGVKEVCLKVDVPEF